MAFNALPKTNPELFTLANDAVQALQLHQAAIGVKQNTDAAVLAALAAARTAEGQFGAAQSELARLLGERTAADTAAKSFIKAARAVLAQILGEVWSEAWAATGFPNQSTAVPVTQEERMMLCQSLKNYLAANPAQEVPQLGVTAANAAARFNALSDGRAAANGGKTAAGQRKLERDAAVLALRKRLRGLIGELEQLLAEDAPEWAAFNLNPPGQAATPESPAELKLSPLGAGMLLAEWPAAARAERYRVWVRRAGETKFRAAATVHDTKARLEGLPSGATVEVRITAANESGESRPGEAVTAVVG